MTDVSFYHLQSEPLEKALPRLLEKVLERGFRVVIRGVSEERIELLDDALWTSLPASFLPHAREGEGVDPAEQPIFLTLDAAQNPSAANVLVLIDDAPAADLTTYERCLYMFDGNNDTVLAAARARWKGLKDQEVAVSYYQQTETGWQKKA
ncbi:DNA polymerase III subunit chi [Sneathiella sp.]|uniref:DNA polymerase III subunit chi n=1 Tax=Sneathiella sp. TaxID=1964365 RepID=UPI003564E17A